MFFLKSPVSQVSWRKKISILFSNIWSMICSTLKGCLSPCTFCEQNLKKMGPCHVDMQSSCVVIWSRLFCVGELLDCSLPSSLVGVDVFSFGVLSSEGDKDSTFELLDERGSGDGGRSL